MSNKEYLYLYTLLFDFLNTLFQGQYLCIITSFVTIKKA